MITSFFNKSKPINIVIAFIISLLAFIIARKGIPLANFTAAFVLKQIAFLIITYSSILLLNFIAKKNNLTKKSNYEILLFSLFILLVIKTTSHLNILISNFFVLLSLRRVLSLRSQNNINKKLFDASFWIAIASLFYFWSILFFLIIILSLTLYQDRDIKHWIIPFLGPTAVFIILSAISIATNMVSLDAFYTYPEFSYNFEDYNTFHNLLAIVFLAIIGTWSFIFYLINMDNKKKDFRISFKIILFSAIIALFIIANAPNKNGSEFLFLFAPLAIVITDYIEIIKKKWFKEIFFLILIAVPFVSLLLTYS